MELEGLRLALKGISAYRNMMDEREMRCMTALLDCLHTGDGEGALTAYTQLFYTLRQDGYESLSSWLFDRLRYEESPYPILLAERRPDPALTEAARQDIATLIHLGNTSCAKLISALESCLPKEYAPVLAALPRWNSSAAFTFEGLTEFYDRNGAGMFSRYRAFLWEGNALTPVEEPDCPDPAKMIGYCLQRNQVIANTRAMLEGNLVNNVLLYGNSGTGKSATVKSLLAVPEFDDLRLVEIQKGGLTNMPVLIRQLAGKRHKFILFIDDLAFDQDDNTYSVMKTILEGGLEKRPANVAIYATSNRRHLVRQTFSDRTGDEVDASETIEEKTSLSDRFGLRIPYLSLNKVEFLALVDQLARQQGIIIDTEALHAQANKWDMRHASRSPRSARQFIASLTL